MGNSESTSKEVGLYDQNLKCVPKGAENILKCTPRDLGKILESYYGIKQKPNDIKHTLALICCCGIPWVICLWIMSCFFADLEAIILPIALMVPLLLSGMLFMLVQYYHSYKVEFYVCSGGLAEYVYEYDKKSDLLQYISKNEYHFNDIVHLQKSVSTKTITVDSMWSKYGKKKNVPEYIFEFHLSNGDTVMHGATKEEDAELLSFLENAEKAWSTFAFDKMMANRKAGEPLSFDSSFNGKIFKGDILVDENGVRVGNDKYRDIFAKSIEISNDAIAFQFADKPTVNRRKEWLVDTGVLFKVLSHFYNIDIDNNYNGTVNL